MSMSGGWQQEDNSWGVQSPVQKAERGDDSPHHKVPSQTLRNHLHNIKEGLYGHMTGVVW